MKIISLKILLPPPVTAQLLEPACCCDAGANRAGSLSFELPKDIRKLNRGDEFIRFPTEERSSMLAPEDID